MSINPIWRQRVLRFRQHRIGYYSLIAFALIFAICLGVNVVANDKPILVKIGRASCRERV